MRTKATMATAVLVGILMTVGCGPSAVYISGGQGASASLDVSAATGSGKIMITGPFVYCEERNTTTEDVDAKPTGKLCRGQVQTK